MARRKQTLRIPASLLPSEVDILALAMDALERENRQINMFARWNHARQIGFTTMRTKILRWKSKIDLAKKKE